MAGPAPDRLAEHGPAPRARHRSVASLQDGRRGVAIGAVDHSSPSRSSPCSSSHRSRPSRSRRADRLVLTEIRAAEAVWARWAMLGVWSRRASQSWRPDSPGGGARGPPAFLAGGRSCGLPRWSSSGPCPEGTAWAHDTVIGFPMVIVALVCPWPGLVLCFAQLPDGYTSPDPSDQVCPGRRASYWLGRWSWTSTGHGLVGIGLGVERRLTGTPACQNCGRVRDRLGSSRPSRGSSEPARTGRRRQPPSHGDGLAGWLLGAAGPRADRLRSLGPDGRVA